MNRRFHVLTVFPEMIESIASNGVLGQARKKGILEVTTDSPRRYTQDIHQTVDDRPFGGADGMVMLVEPLRQAIENYLIEVPRSRRIYLSPQGRPLTDSFVRELAQEQQFLLLCGRYAGVDQRLLNHFEFEEVSIGDYVLSGGELAAMVLVDAVSRQWPGVLGHVDSATKDSFGSGLLEAPLFTRPREILAQVVPEILTSGHHARISEWQNCVGILVTLKKRPDLLRDDLGQLRLTVKEKKQVRQVWLSLTDEEKIALGLIHWQGPGDL